MRKLTSIIMLIFTLFYSAYGLDKYASHSACSEPSSGYHGSTVGSYRVAPDLKMDLEKSDAGHACHMGHCSFTIRALEEVANPHTLSLNRPNEPYPFIISSYRTETLRPPSIL